MKFVSETRVFDTGGALSLQPDLAMRVAYDLFVVQGVSLRELPKLPLVYGIALALAFLTIYVLLPGFFRPRRIQDVPITGRTLRREVPWALLTLFLSSGISMLTVWLVLHGVVVVRGGPVHGRAVALQIAFYFVCVDLYWYGVHRLLHSRPLYRSVHLVHHRSTSPNPITAFVAHPLETLLNGAFLPLFVWLVPVHLYALLFVAVHAPLNNILLHAGHEVFPRWWYEHRLSRWYATSFFHDRHHATVTCNYGLVTTVWDRVFGTLRPAFGEEVAAFHRGVAVRSAEGSRAAAF